MRPRTRRGPRFRRPRAVTPLVALPLLAGLALPALPTPATAVPAAPPGSARAAAPAAPAAQDGQRTVSGGRLDWGVKSSFQSYVTGPVAKGRWTLLDGAATSGESTFRFHSAHGRYDPGKGSLDASFSGGVRFTGHRQADGSARLDLTLANPAVRVTGGSGTLFADIRSKARSSGEVTTRTRVPFASLDLSGVHMRGGSSPIALTRVPAELTAQGAESFAGYYRAGTPLDPVGLSVDLKPAGQGAGDGTDTADGRGARPDSSRTPGRSHGHDGPGVHDIHDAAVDWGIRRTFREYVTGSVARGRWRLSDGARDGGALFRFPAGEGEYDARRHTLTARFSGAVHFRGERLDLRLAAFSVRIEDGTGTLTAEVTREGRTRHRQRLVTFRASDKELEPDDDGLIALDEVPAELTRQGAAAFDGMYAEGATMDPVSLAVALDDDARLPPLPDLGSGADPRADSSHAPGRTAASSSASASSFPWLAGAAAAAALLAAAAAFTLHRTRSRRRAPASAPSGEGSTEGSAGHGSAAKDASAPSVSAKGAPAGDAPAPAAPANEGPVAGASAPDAALASDAATSGDGPVQGAPAEGGTPAEGGAPAEGGTPAGDASAPAAPAKGGPVPDGPASDAGAPGRPSDARPTTTPPADRDPGRP